MTSTGTRPAATSPDGRGPRSARLSSVYRLVASVALGSLLLAVVGAVTGPHWDPGPLEEGIEVATADTSIGGAPELGSHEVRTVDVSVRLDGASVGARLSLPVGVTEPGPAVLFVHGAGTGRSVQAFKRQAHALAEAGVVAMVPDKRLDTYTTRHRDYVAMAGDYHRSLDLLRDRPEVDPDRVVVYAESEGGWIAPVMAAEDPRIAGVVLVSSPVVPPRQQAAFAVDAYLRNTDVPHAVFRAIPRAVGMSMPGGGFEYADFDVSPWQRRMTQPLLVVYGTADASMPIVQGALQVRSDAARAGNTAVTVRYYEGADHGIRVGGSPTPEFLRDLSGWVLGLPATGDAAPRVAGAEPSQAYLAGPVPQPRWLRDGTALLVLVLGVPILMVLCGLAVGATRVVQRTPWGRARRDPAQPPRRFAPGVAWRLAALGGATVATVACLVVYLVAVARLAVDYQRDAWVVQGGWLGVRVLGIVAVLAAVLLARRAHDARLDGVALAPGGVRRVAAVGVLGGSAVLLAVLAYWGVFQLNI
ncbi:alpha/beta hydrolase family protein [Cellulomonas dongxiuzhuiae]|uniref:Prolyl oligopeptidase family serine peptidase n=1 Tax=Cellulomonas dongxiuzhuiae TaxID=2819979 RepID=A0ABX8GFK3_9CELL|nr:prolyl oligopeptidase family serine peptidase [Cellulomonas dongxiuzhuiae]MBO3086840.1 prolyl oligopeptidase family serine peptidase [Cellulomonas dongxiuzhuiae]MBO3093808.1 prolyl oligopeptidase family serine peptidase [Cellulomonas dongxiuzhuiae]QWC14909.1 prolyl oligopeptidase family serine peptidase [Cellulomonas dongxiuzhuiae]